MRVDVNRSYKAVLLLVLVVHLFYAKSTAWQSPQTSEEVTAYIEQVPPPASFYKGQAISYQAPIKLLNYPEYLSNAKLKGAPLIHIKGRCQNNYIVGFIRFSAPSIIFPFHYFW